MKHRYSVIAPTQEMQVWIGEEDPQLVPQVWGTYTELGPFVPQRRSPIGAGYARRIEHAARHLTKPRKGMLKKWAHSLLRDAGEFLVGAFQPIREAI